MSADNLPCKILFLVSGSIACFKAVALCSKLVQAGFELDVVLSPSALEFVGPASFEGLTRRKVHTGVFEPGSMMAHIDLERASDLILNYPATATTLSQFVHGEGSSLLSAIFSAHEFNKPFWIAPAMNQAMIAHPAVEHNIAKLEAWGVRVMMGEAGSLACGEEGAGRLLEPEVMLQEIQNYFNRKQNPKKILLTAGGTSERIDPVRSITNFSTGETGYRIAKYLQSLGHEVTTLQSKHSAFQKGLSKCLPYDTTLEFAETFRNELARQSYDFLIHSAAISDYYVTSVSHPETGEELPRESKLHGNEALIIKLKANPKYIQSARALSKNPKLKIISFKLTAKTGNALGASATDVRQALQHYDSEYIFHNELSQVLGAKHAGTLYKRTPSGSYEVDQAVQTKDELVRLIANRVES